MGRTQDRESRGVCEQEAGSGTQPSKSQVGLKSTGMLWRPAWNTPQPHPMEGKGGWSIYPQTPIRYQLQLPCMLAPCSFGLQESPGVTGVDVTHLSP